MKAKCTPWFRGDTQPLRIGVYERRKPERLVVFGLPETVYSYWNGSWWGRYGSTPDNAFERRGHMSGMQCQPWRGLSEKPQ